MAGVRGRISSALRRASGTAAKAAPAKKAVPAKAAATKVAAKAAPAKKAAPAQAVPATAPAKKVPAKKAPPAKKVAPAKKAAPPAKKTVPAKKVPAKKAAPAEKTVPAKKAPAKKAVPAKKASAAATPRATTDLSAGELKEIRAQLRTEFSEMQAEYDRALAELNALQMTNTDGAGDDQADAGSKTFDREQEQSIAANRHDLLIQIEHAIERIDAGTYGICENCGRPIPKARLKALPMATLDAECKAREERH